MTEQQMPARIWVTAEDHAASWPGSFKRYHASNLDHGDEYPQFVRADIAERMAEALSDTATLLKSFSTPDDATAKYILDQARSALSDFRSVTQDTEARHDDLCP